MNPPAEAPRLTPVPIQKVHLDDAFWSPKMKIWRETTIADCFEKFEQSDHNPGGAMNNFDMVRDGKSGKHVGPPWYDGLIYEMVRGSADFLAARRDPALEAQIDGYVERIAAAQAKSPDSYINTWTQMMAPPAQRWGMNGGDDRWQHDFYNAGMMIEAGVHYYRATGKPALLAAATRLADLMCDTIGPPPRANAIPGHSGPEEALVKLTQLYRQKPSGVRMPKDPDRYLKLAEFFVDIRGHHEGRTDKDHGYGAYCQDQAPLADQKSIEGHAVRAMLFCTGIAAAAELNGRAEYLAALDRFWENLTRKRIYISGAAGAISNDEKFGSDYFLPNDGYMETCAAIGVGFFAHRMHLLHADARYIDVLEQALYNAIPGGVSLAGNSYFYHNPLEGKGLKRWDWHDCPCCPPMFLKIMGALPGYVYSQADGAAYVNLFVGSRAELDLGGTKVRLKQTTRYPWDGAVKIEVEPENAAEFDLCVRMPGWLRTDPASGALYQPEPVRYDGPLMPITINGQPAETVGMGGGYARLRREWKAGDRVEIKLKMPVRRVMAHPGVESARGKAALMRGPVLYCAETADNPGGVDRLPAGAALTPEHRPELLGGVTVLKSKELTAVPFYAAWNRDAGSMRVWLPVS